MYTEQFIAETSGGVLGLRKSSIRAVEEFINEIRTAPFQANRQAPKLSLLGSNIESIDSDDPFSTFEEGSVAIIPIIGPMFKYGTWRSYGVDEMADLLKMADQSSNIIGTILLINTPGGNIQSLYRMEDVLRNRTKPNVSLVDGGCHSCGMYVGSFSDQILATNRMCSVGSIGVYATMVDDKEMLKRIGLKEIEVYPPESKFKNKAIRDAIDGKTQALIDEVLSPFAQHFQNIVKTNRPKLNLKVEGILEGKDLYAYDAITHGLIDGISNLTGAVELVAKLAEEQKSIYQPFKN